ncbi:response regulator receiver domain [Shewanella glacialipiscicola]|uniref:response regulator receiver domain n=1 Tax=Shewanella glacialipiscicola TaxID=614069 RepID=UPI003D7B2B52
MVDIAMALEQQEIVPTPTYEELIHEAFISPIRNITVIDDEYPTLAQFLSYQVGGTNIPENQVEPQNLQRLQKIISLCHVEKNWSIDVFDGKTPELGSTVSIPPHLNHSDLVVLDYHLNGEPTTDNGAQARRIIEVLEGNNHFNIILVHTKGFDGGDIEKVFNEILCQFVSNNLAHNFNVAEDAEQKIEDWLDGNDEGTEFSFFQKTMGIQDVLKHLEFSAKQSIAIRSPKHFLYGFEEEVSKASQAIGINSDELIRWYLGCQIKDKQKHFEGKCHGNFKWCWDGAEKPNYIATGRVFISVIRKQDGEPNEELIEPLKRSLMQLDASPMHLLMAKMRHVIDEKGLEQANEIVSKREAQAGWLYNLITRGEGDVYEHDTVIDAHWEQLARSTKHELREFSKKLITAAIDKVQGSPKDVVKHFFKECVIDRDKTLGHLNAFNCSQPMLGGHLTTGTVFEAEGKYWICLSPACDLVPREREQWATRIGNDYLAFKAVELHRVIKLSVANSNANSNDYIYLILNGEPTAFCIASGNGNGNPIWDTFYAGRKGSFGEEGRFLLTCIRQKRPVLSEVIEEQTQNVSIFELESLVLEAKAIVELRYEYALNLLHKFGANQTRVGLGFTDSAGFIQ